MKNKKSKNYLVIVLIIALLAIAIGYSLYTSELKITGTATANAKWDVHFTNPQAPTGDTATLNTDNDLLTVNVGLGYPGDKSTVTVDIKNDSSLAAKITTFTITAKDGSSKEISVTDGSYTYGAIKMTVDSLSTDDTIASGDSETYTMTFEWPSTYTNVETVNDTMTFDITFNYQQAN